MHKSNSRVIKMQSSIILAQGPHLRVIISDKIRSKLFQHTFILDLCLLLTASLLLFISSGEYCFLLTYGGAWLWTMVMSLFGTGPEHMHIYYLKRNRSIFIDHCIDYWIVLSLCNEKQQLFCFLLLTYKAVKLKNLFSRIWTSHETITQVRSTFLILLMERLWCLE